MSTKRLALGAVLISLLIAGVLSWYASTSPDGLEHVAETEGFSRTAQEHPAEDGPFAGYETKGVANQRLSGGLAGLVGLGATGLVMGGLVLALGRRDRSDVTDPPDATLDSRR